MILGLENSNIRSASTAGDMSIKLKKRKTENRKATDGKLKSDEDILKFNRNKLA